MDVMEISESGRMSREDADDAHELDLPITEPEIRAQRLGFALKSLAAELVAERRKVAQLRKELRQLKARLASQRPTEGNDRPDAAGSRARATRPTSDAR